jgi:serine/threonine-protein kinase
MWGRDFSEAIAWAEKMPGQSPFVKVGRSFIIAVSTVGLEGAEGARDEVDAAVREVQAVLDASPGNATMRGWLATLYAIQGKSEPALQEARLAVSIDAKDAFAGPVSLSTLATVHALLGREDEAIDLLERLIVTQSQSPITVHILELDSTWDPLRQNPRFQALLEKHREKIP